MNDCGYKRGPELVKRFPFLRGSFIGSPTVFYNTPKVGMLR